MTSSPRPGHVLVHLSLPLCVPFPAELHSPVCGETTSEFICNVMFGKPPPKGEVYNAGDESEGNAPLAEAVGGKCRPAEFQVCSQKMRTSGWEVLVCVLLLLLPQTQTQTQTQTSALTF